MKKYLAEALGAFTLTFVVALSLAGKFPVSTPVLAALVLGMFVYSLGHISGTHINPAVTIGAWSIKKITTVDAVVYVVAQCVGALLAFGLATLVGVSATSSYIVAGNTLGIGLAEMFGTFFFTFGIASVMYGRTPSQLSGVVVGGSLLLGISIAALLGSNGILNPAVALGIGSVSFMYLFAPIVGSIVGMNVYKYLGNI